MKKTAQLIIGCTIVGLLMSPLVAASPKKTKKKLNHAPWGSYFTTKRIYYLDVGTGVYPNLSAFGESLGFDLAGGVSMHPFGLEARFSYYRTSWGNLKSPLSSNSAYDFNFRKPKLVPGAENAEELQNKSDELSGVLYNNQLLLTLRQSLYKKLNLAIKMGPAMVFYKDSYFAESFEGYTLSFHGGLEYPIWKKLYLNTSLSAFHTILTRSPSFAEEQEKWRELPIKFYSLMLSLLYSI